MLKRLIVQLLFRLLGNSQTYQAVNIEHVNQWLASQKQNVLFHEYWKLRDYQILKTFGTGLTGDNNMIVFGQRVEHLRLLAEVDRAYKEKEKVKRKITAQREAGIKINKKKGGK